MLLLLALLLPMIIITGQLATGAPNANGAKARLLMQI